METIILYLATRPLSLHRDRYTDCTPPPIAPSQRSELVVFEFSHSFFKSLLRNTYNHFVLENKLLFFFPCVVVHVIVWQVISVTGHHLQPGLNLVIRA